MTLDDVYNGITSIIDFFRSFLSIDFWLNLLSLAFDTVFDFLSPFIIDRISKSFSTISITGDLVLSTFYKLFSSFDISDFLLIFVGFSFTFFIIKFVIRFIRG